MKSRSCTFPLSHCITMNKTQLDLFLAQISFSFFPRIKSFSSNQGQWKVIKILHIIPAHSHESFLSYDIALNTSTCTWIVPFIRYCTCHPLISKEYLILCYNILIFFLVFGEQGSTSSWFPPKYPTWTKKSPHLKFYQSQIYITMLY